jgi:hypothetical protein
MLWFLFISTIFSKSTVLSKNFTELEKLSFKDFDRKDLFMIYIYYENPDTECPACTAFNKQMASIQSLPIKTVNFYTNLYLGSHLLEFVFPAFIIRENKKSYVLNPKSFEELLNLIDSGDWRQEVPVKWYLDVNSPFIKLFAIPCTIFFYVMNKWAYVVDNTPSFVITTIVCFIIAYLIVSIINIFRTDLTKVKKD